MRQRFLQLHFLVPAWVDAGQPALEFNNAVCKARAKDFEELNNAWRNPGVKGRAPYPTVMLKTGNSLNIITFALGFINKPITLPYTL